MTPSEILSEEHYWIKKRYRSNGCFCLAGAIRESCARSYTGGVFNTADTKPVVNMIAKVARVILNKPEAELFDHMIVTSRELARLKMNCDRIEAGEGDTGDRASLEGLVVMWNDSDKTTFPMVKSILQEARL